MGPELEVGLSVVTLAAGLVPLVRLLRLPRRPRRSGNEQQRRDGRGPARIRDLKNPILRVPFKSIGSIVPNASNLTVKAVLKDACKNTGLKDFGDEKEFPFRQGLSVLLSSLLDELPKLTLMGQQNSRKQLVGVLERRLKIVDLVKRHPEILKEEIKDPVFIVGPQRAGGGHLHKAFSNHEAFKALKRYETTDPVMTPEVEEALENGEDDPRFAQAEKGLKWLVRMRPQINCLSEVSADLAQDESPLMACTFSYPTSPIPASVPKFLKHAFQQDKSCSLEFLKLALKVIQWQDAKVGRKRKRFMLQTHAAAHCLPELVKVFPDAKFIQVCRRATVCMVSSAHLAAYTLGISYKVVDLHAVGRQTLENFSMTLEKFAQDHGKIKDRSCIIKYEDYAQDNASCVRRALEFLGETTDDEALENVMRFLKDRPRHCFGSIEYVPGAFGFNMKEAEHLLSPYTRYLSDLRKATSP